MQLPQPAAAAAAPKPAPKRRRWLLLLLVPLLLMQLRVFRQVMDLCFLPIIWLPAMPTLMVWGTGLSSSVWPGPVIFSLKNSGPVFIKLGQWLSTRRDLLPDNLCDAMSVLHEQVPSRYRRQEVQQAEALIEGLKLNPKGENQPLGGGCIAQVYQGTFESEKWGRNRSVTVAVKVLRPNIRERLEMELWLLHGLAHVGETLARLRPVTYLFPSMETLKWLRPRKIIDDFATYMMQQVNLTQEAAHMDRFRKNFKMRRRVLVPNVYATTLDESVLVMGMADGVSLSNYIQANTAKEERLAVHKLLTDMMAKMGVEDGFLHGDLHPGNLFIAFPKKKPVVTLIDTGISIAMTHNLTRFTQSALMAALGNNPDGLGESVVDLHRREGCMAEFDKNETGQSNETDLIHRVGNLLLAGCWMADEPVWSVNFASFDDYNGTQVGEYFNMLMSILTLHRVPVATDLWAMMTAFALIEGSITELGYGVNVLRAAVPYLLKHALQSFSGLYDYFVTSTITLKKSDKESEDKGRLKG